MQACQARQQVDLLAFSGTMIHQRHEGEVQQSGVEDQEKVIRIPPSIKKVGGHREPRKTEPCLAQSKEHRQYNQQEEQERPGVEKHGKVSAAIECGLCFRCSFASAHLFCCRPTHATK